MCDCQPAERHDTPGEHTASVGMSMSTCPVRHFWRYHPLADELSEILIQSSFGVFSRESGCQFEELISWQGSMPLGTGVQIGWPCSIPRKTKRTDGLLVTC